jgi:hypothetical protein
LQKGQEDRHFEMTKAISAKMRAGLPVENRERLVGVSSQAQMIGASRSLSNPAAWHSLA